MKHYGDIMTLKGDQIPIVDVITFGAPCQDISVAGLRKGMLNENRGDEETTRSGLFFEAIRVIKEMRENDRKIKGSGVDIRFLRPRYAIYENVPGSFSSNKGKDFQSVLTEIVKIADASAPDVPMPEVGRWSKSGCLYDEMGRWSVAWKLHDAQFWGVPQRRKRVCVLADFNGLSAPQILFDYQYWGEAQRTDANSFVGNTSIERTPKVLPVGESLQGNSEQGSEEGQGIAGDSEKGVGESDQSG